MRRKRGTDERLESRRAVRRCLYHGLACGPLGRPQRHRESNQLVIAVEPRVIAAHQGCPGVNRYIVKPVDFDQFTEAIREFGLYGLNQPPVT